LDFVIIFAKGFQTIKQAPRNRASDARGTASLR
jgi:hypothetical protein